MSTKLLIAGALVSALARVASAHPDDDIGDQVLAPPPTFQANDVGVTEQLGAHLPVEAQFRDQDGKSVRLGEVLAGDQPTILTFNYSDCPMLCSLQLNGLSAVLPELAKKAPMLGADKDVGFGLGSNYRIVTIDLAPGESLEKMQKMRERYYARLPENMRQGWTFLVGDADTIARVAKAVGFQYKFLPEKAEYAHPAALIFLSSAGAVTRYVYGIDFPVPVMRESIFKAGLAEPANAVGFMNRCYHFDPDANSATHGGVMALRIGAAGFIVLLIGGIYFMRKHGGGQ